MIILIYTTYSEHVENWLMGFICYLEATGCKVIVRNSPITLLWLKLIVPFLDHIFIWNGESKVHNQIKDAASLHAIDYTIVEVGFFPQKTNIVFDRKGINANSELMDDSLDWITHEHEENLDALKSRYIGGYCYSGLDEYVLCPLQLETDTNIKLHSPYAYMQDFIDHAESKFPLDEIIFKKHPLDKNKNLHCSSQNRILEKGDILEIAQDAKLVYGINSTSLLETGLMSVPTVSIGSGYLNIHEGHVQKLLAALADKQIDINEENFGYWLDRYTNFPKKPVGSVLFRYILVFGFSRAAQVLHSQYARFFSCLNLAWLKALI